MVILPLLHWPVSGLILFAVIFSVYFLYYLLWFFLPQSQGVKHFQAKRYEEAAAAFQTVLSRRPPGGIDADTRRRLADTLDVLGRTEEAAQERERAEASAARNPKDAMALQAQGDLLTRKHQYNEACEEYFQALPTCASARPTRPTTSSGRRSRPALRA